MKLTTCWIVDIPVRSGRRNHWRRRNGQNISVGVGSDKQRH